MFSRFFIERPIFATVLAIVILIAGSITVFTLPVAQYPDIVPPTVEGSAVYPGANAEVLAATVAAPIEQEVNGVENMIYMYSTNANNGQMILNVNFEVESDPDTDQILVQMRYSQAQSQLPSAVEKYGVTVQKSMGSPLAVFSLVSPKGTYDALFLTNYAYININSPMTRVRGVGWRPRLRSRRFSAAHCWSKISAEAGGRRRHLAVEAAHEDAPLFDLQTNAQEVTTDRAVQT